MLLALKFPPTTTYYINSKPVYLNNIGAVGPADMVDDVTGGLKLL